MRSTIASLSEAIMLRRKVTFMKSNKETLKLELSTEELELIAIALWSREQWHRSKGIDSSPEYKVRQYINDIKRAPAPKASRVIIGRSLQAAKKLARGA